MELKKFYESIGVDYKQVLHRLRKEERIEKYLHLMTKDENYKCLEQAVEDHDYEETFRAAHSLKGICLNLDLRPLTEAVDVLVEYLRGRQVDGAKVDGEKVRVFFESIRKEYSIIIKAIGE